MTDYNPQNFLILAVDDNPVNRILMEKILKKQGYMTKMLSRSTEVLPYLAKQQPDLILMDLMMPNLNGLELSEQIQSNSLYQEIPIIFITASNEKQDLLKAFDSGAVDYVTKPFHHQELLARIKIHLELKFTRDELKKALLEVEQLAQTDELTGVSNRRNFYSLAGREFNLANRRKRNFALLIIDIDHFKTVNDTYGHFIGDEAIKYVAQECAKNLRQEDVCARWGGEEFVVLLSDTDLDEAVTIAGRMRKNVDNQVLTINSSNIHLTVSIGVSVYNQEDQYLDNTISRADKALYHAKIIGRNKVVSEKELPSA